jgi:hypothetical protein
MGLIPTAKEVKVISEQSLEAFSSSLMNEGWDLAKVQGVANALFKDKTKPASLEGCCVSSMWCDGNDQDGFYCFTHGLNANRRYINHGWLGFSNHEHASSALSRPVFTCRHPPSRTRSSSSILRSNIVSTIFPLVVPLPLVQPSKTETLPTTMLTMTGVGWGDYATDMRVMVGTAVCTDVQVGCA